MISPHEMPLQFNCVDVKAKRDKPFVIVVIIIIIDVMRRVIAISTIDSIEICNCDRK